MENSKRQEYKKELRRLQEACMKSKSIYLRRDYGKRIKRMQRELREYDYFHRRATK